MWRVIGGAATATVAICWAGSSISGVADSEDLAPLRVAQAAAVPPRPSNAAGATAGMQQTPAYAATINQYCVTCHSSRTHSGNLVLEGRSLVGVSQDAALWEKVVRKLRAGAMPPAGMPRPDSVTSERLISFVESALDAAAARSPNPGRPSLHRLNRVEYGNAVRDLLALKIDAAELLPPDDATFGFDNISDALNVSPALLERYLAAAERVSELAVGDPAIVPGDTIYRARMDLTQTGHVDGLPLGTRGGLLVQHTFPVDAEYEVRIRLWRTNVNIIRGLQFPHQVEVTLDGERVHLATVGGRNEWVDHLMNPTDTGTAIDARLRVRVPVKAGPRTLGATFVQKTAAKSPDLLQPFESTLDPVDSNGIPRIEMVTIAGPFNVTSSGETPSRRRIFSCRPTADRGEEVCARSILGRLARLAYRRPVVDRDVETLLDFYRLGRDEGTFDRGIQMALRRMLVDPEFIFRVERDPAGVMPKRPYRLSSLELASRLAFFLWSSLPDAPLLDAAAAGQLHDPAVLEQQVRRMLADRRAEALVTNFAAQWLYLRNLRSAVPDPLEFPDFDDNLRQAFKRETELLIASVMQEDRSALDLLTADYTFLNERLARHYGIPHVYGSHFRRVVVSNPARRGVLGHGSILTVTSYANRTSPVLRGKWILENLLGSPPPAPPPDVPALSSAHENGKVLSVRERMEAHRASPTCASCHRLMDPLGFALEQFDGVGAWRIRDGGSPIDPSTQLADGRVVDGPVSLRNAILERPETFVATMTEKLMTYALGRGVDYYDMPAVRKVLRDSAPAGYRFSSLVLGIVRSTPFQMRMPVGEGRVARAGTRD